MARKEEKIWSDVEKKRKKHKEQREKRQHDGKKKKLKKLKHAVHHLRINAHKYKSSKRQNSTKESRRNNKLAAHRGEPCALNTLPGGDVFFPSFFKQSINSTK